jgi:hypothetical protein
MDWVGFWVKTCLILQECPKKCPFWPLRVEVLKKEIKEHKKPGCDHYAHKMIFSSKKNVIVNFWVKSRVIFHPFFVFD